MRPDVRPKHALAPLLPQLLQQRLCLLQIARVKPFGEPLVNRGKQFARLLHLALVTREACEAQCGAEFPGFGLLLARDVEGALKICFCFCCIRLRPYLQTLA
jgi:hypothetical protein